MLSLYNCYACGVLLFSRGSRYGVSYAEMESARNPRPPPGCNLTPSQLSGYALSQQVPMRECALYPQENMPLATQSNLGHNFVPYMRQSKTSIATSRTDDLRVESDISEENSFQAFPVCHVTGKSIRPISSRENCKPEAGQETGSKGKRQSSLRQSHRSKSNERRKPEKSVSFRGPISSD